MKPSVFNLLRDSLWIFNPNRFQVKYKPNRFLLGVKVAKCKFIQFSPAISSICYYERSELKSYKSRGMEYQSKYLFVSSLRKRIYKVLNKFNSLHYCEHEGFRRIKLSECSFIRK